MSRTSTRTVLAQHLKRITESETDPKSSDLLKAYALFCTLRQDTTRGDLHAGFLKLTASKHCPRNVAFSLSPSCTLHDLTNAADAFSAIPLDGFLRFIVPDLVADVCGIMSAYRRYFNEDLLLLTHYIFRVKNLLYRIAKEDTWADYSEDPSASDSHDDLRRFYDLFKKNEAEDGCLPFDHFSDLYKYINLFPLDFGALSIKPVSMKQKEVDELADIFFNQLELSRTQMIEVCHLFYVGAKRRVSDFYVPAEYRFLKIKDIHERKELIQRALILLAKTSPADALSLISVRRKAPYKRSDSAHPRSDYNYAPNDTMLDTSLVFSLFSSTLDLADEDVTKNRSVTILFPSVFFIRKWLSDKMLSKRKVTFVFANKLHSELIHYHYNEGSYEDYEKENVTFVDFTSWISFSAIRNEHILAFFIGTPIETQDEIYHALYRRASEVDITLLLGAHEFETARSPFSTALMDSHFRFRRIELIPQGIANSAFPRRKILVSAEINPPTAFDTPIKIVSYVLNRDIKTPSIARSTFQPLGIEPTDLNAMDMSIRGLFKEEMLRRMMRGGKRAMAFKVPFSLDLTLWCSKSYPKNNLDRPRVEAYFCMMPSEEKSKRGGMERGLVLNDTKKRTVTQRNDTEIASWLLSEYPFAYVRGRRSEKKAALPAPYTSIRESAIEYYTEALRGENIALKTLWYLYPNVENTLSERDYKQLSLLVMKTEIGLFRVQDVTSELVESTLEESFPQASENQLFQMYCSIYKLIDKGIEEGYCDDNPLAQAIQDKKTRDKLFAQVRKAMTKRHFTKDEFIAAYQRAVELFYSGCMEALGVIVRLLTGLSSNVICALKEKDIIALPDYGIQKIVVTRQLTNDGKTTKGFESIEDYLCFPSSDLLWKHLQELKDITRQQYPAYDDYSEWPIVRASKKTKRYQHAWEPVPPQELDALCIDLLSDLDLPDHFVTLPSQKDGTKETNLNHYGGDFFRENFRYWSLSQAGMTNDETAYLIGNVPETTYGRFYCDYLNDASQYLLYVKLLRLDALLEGKNQMVATSEKITVKDGHFNKYFRTSSTPMSVQAEIRFSADASKLELGANCKHGFSGFIVEIQKGAV